MNQRWTQSAFAAAVFAAAVFAAAVFAAFLGGWAARAEGPARGTAIGGTVIAVGGGGTPEAVPALALKLARERFDAPVDVVVIPHASRRADRGKAPAAMWREAGAGRVEVMPDTSHEALRLLDEAEVIWMGGGSQTRLLAHLREQGLVAALLRAHQRGAVVGGTSAGAAVLGSVTVAGSPEPMPYVQGSMTREPGLGLVPDAIVDQHFAERRREGRLITALLEGGASRGFGISEGTAAVFNGDGFDVVGRATVVVLDTSAARRATAEPSEWMMATGLRLDVVRSGARWMPPKGD